MCFEIWNFYSFDQKKFWIFQDLNPGPLDLKLLTLPLDHEVSSEDRKKTSKVIVQSNQIMAGDSKIQKFKNCKLLSLCAKSSSCTFEKWDHFCS